VERRRGTEIGRTGLGLEESVGTQLRQSIQYVGLLDKSVVQKIHEGLFDQYCKDGRVKQ
jgi:hypothetical protein